MDTLGLHYQSIAELDLVPVISSNTLRYNRSSSIQPYYHLLDAGPSRHNRREFSWRRLVHPEGQPYFVMTDKFEFAVVTPANVEDAPTETRIIDYARLASGLLQHYGISVPSQCELVLELADDYTFCNYYFVDHLAKKLFWLAEVDSEQLGIPPAKSLSHLEPMLQGYYWVYIEYFPMHHQSREKGHGEFLDELYNILTHGQADRLTSTTSTFPYAADQCKQFLDLLSRRGNRIDGYTLCFAARIMGAIMNQRFNTYYGQEFAQLDRQQYATDSYEHQWMWAAANLLMWQTPHYYNSLLEDIYANGTVSDQWAHFLSRCMADWNNSLLWSFPVLITGILLVIVAGNISVGITPVLSSSICIFSASCLHLWHRSFIEGSPATGIDHIRLAKSDTAGFLLLSFVFSLPRASYIWSVLLFIVQFLLVAYHKGSPLAVLLIAGLLMIFIFCLVWQVVFPDERSMVSLFQSFISLVNPRLRLSETNETFSV